MCNNVKSNHTHFFAPVRRNRRLKQRIVAVRADNGAVVSDFPYMVRALAHYYAIVYRINEGTAEAVNDYECPTLHTNSSTQEAPHIAKCSGPDDLHPFMSNILANF